MVGFYDPWTCYILRTKIQNLISLLCSFPFSDFHTIRKKESLKIKSVSVSKLATRHTNQAWLFKDGASHSHGFIDSFIQKNICIMSLHEDFDPRSRDRETFSKKPTVLRCQTANMTTEQGGGLAYYKQLPFLSIYCSATRYVNVYYL